MKRNFFSTRTLDFKYSRIAPAMQAPLEAAHRQDFRNGRIDFEVHRTAHMVYLVVTRSYDIKNNPMNPPQLVNAFAARITKDFANSFDGSAVQYKAIMQAYVNYLDALAV